MADPCKRFPSKPDRSTKPPGEQPGARVEEDPAVERGERIATGKQIARGGKTTGSVPGTTADADR